VSKYQRVKTFNSPFYKGGYRGIRKKGGLNKINRKEEMFYEKDKEAFIIKYTSNCCGSVVAAV
jgi:hypothetical protein